MPVEGLECSYSIAIGEKVVARNYVQVSGTGGEGILVVSKMEIFAMEQLGLRSDRRLTKLKYRNDFGPVSCETYSERFGSHSVLFVEQLVDGKAFNERFDWVIENNALGLLECGIRIMLETGKKSWRFLNLDDGSAFEFLLAAGKDEGILETNLQLNVDTKNDFAISSATPILKIHRSVIEFPDWNPSVYRAEVQGRASQEIVERDIILKSAEVQISATLCSSASEPFSYFVVLVGGSGVHDRNGDLPGMSVGYDAWAKHLAVRGVASVRFDRYPFNEHQQEAIETLGFTKAVSQVNAALDYAKHHARGKPLAVIGHSLGATLVAAATQGRQDVQVCVLLSATAKSLRELIREQSVSFAKAVTDDAEHQNIIKSQTEDYLKAIDVGAELKERKATLLTCEMLDLSVANYAVIGQQYCLIHGTADVQVSVDDGISLNALLNLRGGHSTISMLPNRNHIFERLNGPMEAEEDQTSRKSEAAETVATSILEALNRMSKPI
jgi:hypothetical protein